MTGYCSGLNGYFDCTGHWRWSCWSLLFRWFGVVRLEVMYDMGGGVLNYRKANVDEWGIIVTSAEGSCSAEGCLTGGYGDGAGGMSR